MSVIWPGSSAQRLSVESCNALMHMGVVHSNGLDCEMWIVNALHCNGLPHNVDCQFSASISPSKGL